MIGARNTLKGLVAVALAAVSTSVPASQDWSPVRTIDGVPVESRPTDSGINVHRAHTSVCTDLAGLEGFVADTSRFRDWIPFTRSARLLDQSEGVYVYYVRSATPWPMKDKDMIYRISRQETNEEGLRLVITGLPDYEPPAKNADRIREAIGEWRLLPVGDGIRVSYELYVDVGAVPAFFANRRLATVVGRTLANLTAEFPCSA